MRPAKQGELKVQGHILPGSGQLLVGILFFLGTPMSREGLWMEHRLVRGRPWGGQKGSLSPFTLG